MLLVSRNLLWLPFSGLEGKLDNIRKDVQELRELVQFYASVQSAEILFGVQEVLDTLMHMPGGKAPDRQQPVRPQPEIIELPPDNVVDETPHLLLETPGAQARSASCSDCCFTQALALEIVQTQCCALYHASVAQAGDLQIR
jgi:hypothetical protein